MSAITTALGSIFGTTNSRMLKSYTKRLRAINALEEDIKKLSDEELCSAFGALKLRASGVYDEDGALIKEPEPLNSLLNESFAITREASSRILGLRHFDVQIIGGMVLNDGRIAEMKTGEGKTLVATLAAALNALSGHTVHIVTVNDYLAKRDAVELAPLYEFLGYKVSFLTAAAESDEERMEVYSANIIYGTNNEFGFDYLRDNMKYSLDEKLQKEHYYAIIDEIDSILIDEARTPLIISGPVNIKTLNYRLADEVAKKLVRDKDFTIDEKNRVIMLTEEGIPNAEKLFKVDNLYSIENASLSHNLDQALKANYLFIKDKDYVVNEDGVTIVDEFTGRLSEGRRFSEGLHQAIEAKEDVEIKEESQTLADITFQNYFRLYKKLSGMTGTAQTEASEFIQIYNLEVVSIPTNVKVMRDDKNDLIYKSEKEKFDAVVKKTIELHKKGQPVLIGTASIEKSELLHEIFKKNKIPHNVLNAKNHAREALIIQDAGLKGAITIATNMAGRGVDIKLSDEVKDLGGLYIIGTERHESRRIDNQLRGRSGRQGDVGTSQFYLSLEDSLLRIFGSEKIKNIMEKLGLKEGEHIDSGLVTRSVEGAQKKVENLHFESRKHLLEYDDVANEQRKAIYTLRNQLLDSEYDIMHKIEDNKEYALEYVLSEFANLDELDTALVGERLREVFNTPFSPSELEGLSLDEIKELASSKIDKELIEKFSIIEESERLEIYRIIYLQVLDNAYREHLYTMDNLKTGIGLRGYNQKDPLVEYKKESYALFLELIEAIKLEAIKLLCTVSFEPRDSEGNVIDADASLIEEERELARLRAKMEQDNKSLVYNMDEDGEIPSIASKKIKRNELCPCGSGKKYKQCCGKSGPKQGMLAK